MAKGKFSSLGFVSTRPFSYWLTKNRYYHQRIKNFCRLVMPENSRVLHINGKNGYILDAIKASYGVCVDEDESTLEAAREKYPHFHFYSSLDELSADQSFDYIILTLVTMETYDIQMMLTKLHRFCHARTRVVLESYSYWWKPILRITQKLGLSRPTVFTNWVSQFDLHNFLYLAGFDAVIKGRYLLFPFYIPIVSYLLNTVFAHLPLLNRLCLNEWIVARPFPVPVDSQKITVSVVIPCKNERGNIEEAVKSCPEMGKETELIFVEGNSQDGTLGEIRRVIEAYPKKKIRCYMQEGKGKADAVRKGFAHAHGDVFMILDGDLTMPAHELQKFFNAIVMGTGEFVNGSRLIYGMESGAMTVHSLMSNYFISILISWLLSQRVKDTLCGTKVLWRQDYEKVVNNRAFFGTIDPFGDFDLLFGAARFCLKIIDMPIHYKRRMYGSTQIRRFHQIWFLIGISLNGLRKCKFWS